MWAAGLLAAMSSITYPAISAYVSIYADVDQQGEGHAYKENIFSSNIFKFSFSYYEPLIYLLMICLLTGVLVRENKINLNEILID